jgi:dihydroorotate dehydrogenase
MKNIDLAYSFIKAALFKLDPEFSHHLTLACLKRLAPFLRIHTIHRPTHVMGIDFPNVVGLAAGLDKNAAYVDALAHLGFGFLEVGTVTPRPQAGNPTPRLFRLKKEKALINRMGFNNVGIDQFIKNLQQQKYGGVLGINIGKNADTPLENAIADYKLALNCAYKHAHYVVVNISSPNTEGLRSLQSEAHLPALLEALKTQQLQLSQEHRRYVPLVIKLSPDLDEIQIEQVAYQLISFEIDGVIAVNTTVSRKGVEGSKYARENGGLSGAPLSKRSTEVIQQLYAILANRIPIIASGGVMSAEDATEKLKAGAKLLQLYTGLIYEGPSLINHIIAAHAL